MTVLEVIQRSAEFLANKGVESPRLQVELLLSQALRIPRLRLYLEFDRRLTTGELDLVRGMVKRRGGREPLQHIIGSTSFCGLEIIVTPDVLIPRPETELLAENAWRHVEELAAASVGPVRVLDFGTGSGCLIIAIAAKCASMRGWALDISEMGLRVARENAARHQVADRIEFVSGDGFEPLSGIDRFDLIVSNPPYIPSGEIEQLAPEVRDHDPRRALDGGPDGLQFFRRLASEAKPFMSARGKIMLEFGDGQQCDLERIFTGSSWRIEAIKPDYSGRSRIMIAARGES